MPLDRYIAAYYGGNKSEFAAAIGRPRQRVNEWVKSGDWYVYDGKLMQEKITVPTPQ